jgi:hypothetical protein
MLELYKLAKTCGEMEFEIWFGKSKGDKKKK